MSITVADVVLEARTNAGDLDLKWTDAQFEAALQAFFTQVGGSNSEALLDSRGRLQAIPTGLTVAAADVWPWDSIYRAPAVSFLCFKYHSGDSEDTRDAALAAKYKGEFDKFFAPAKDN